MHSTGNATRVLQEAVAEQWCHHCAGHSARVQKQRHASCHSGPSQSGHCFWHALYMHCTGRLCVSCKQQHECFDHVSQRCVNALVCVGVTVAALQVGHDVLLKLPGLLSEVPAASIPAVIDQVTSLAAPACPAYNCMQTVLRKLLPLKTAPAWSYSHLGLHLGQSRRGGRALCWCGAGRRRGRSRGA